MAAEDDGVHQMIDSLVSAADGRLEASDAADLSARAARQLPRAIELLGALYGAQAHELVSQLLEDFVELAAARPAELRELDRRRCADPNWFQDSSMIGYVCFADKFGETLAGATGRLDHLERLGVRYLHLMSVLEPRPGESDGGYAVADYDAVDPRIGTMADLSELARQLHERDMSLCVDLVLNHTAREHLWAQAAMRGEQHFREFYFVFPDRSEPDEWEQTVPDIFPVLAPGSFTFVPELDAWVWTTFREFQWDLDYRNPAVFRAMTATMITLANRGPDVLRLDAVPFLWKRKGTDCQNQPEAHLLLQALRCVLSIVAPGVLLKAEAMVAPEILTGYLGAHDGTVRPECDLAYDNQLMVMLWDLLATGDSALAGHALNSRPAAPDTTSWVAYLRCHDDIGWAVSDADAKAVGAEGTARRAELSSFYAGGARRWHSLGVAFQPGERGASPISGMAAALTGLEAARDAGDDAGVDAALRRIEALYSVVFSFGGIPLVYMGDEIGLGNDAHWGDDPAHHGDNRWMHRPPMDWEAVATARSEPTSIEGRLLARFAALAHARAELPGLGARRPTQVVDLGVDGAFAYVRGDSEPDAVLAVVDIAGDGIAALETPGGKRFRLVHTGVDAATVSGATLTIPPYGWAWLVEDVASFG